MAAWTCKLSFALAYWTVFNGIECVTALQQIFHKPHSQYPSYPIINADEHLSNTVIADCKDFLRQNLTLDSVCTNGTVPYCVENNSPPMKEFRFICKPTGTCDRNARSIVYLDRRSPDMYWLGKKSCKGGYKHSEDGDCFKPCNVWDGRIRIFEKSTATSPTIVYCNYEYRYCNPAKPKLFELTRESDVCSLRLDKLCPAGMDRLSDCSCAEKCKDGFRRDPADSFKCKNDINHPGTTNYIQETSKELIQISNLTTHSQTTTLRISWCMAHSTDDFSLLNHIEVSFKCKNDINHPGTTNYIQETSKELIQISNLTTHSQTTTLRISWCMAHSTDDFSLLNHIEVYYRAANNGTVNDLPTIFPDDDCQCVVIEHLFPGKKYILFVKFVFEHHGENVSDIRRITEKTKPKPVEDLNATFFGKIIGVEWRPPDDSMFDNYFIIVRNNREEKHEAKIYETSYDLQLIGGFPGEKYEIAVYTVSNDVKSDKQKTHMIIPPLPPKKLYCSLLPGGDQGTDRHVFWFNHDKFNYVDGYYITYNSTGDSQVDVYIPITHGQEEISYDLRNLQLRQTYTILVKSQVEGGNSTASTQIVISIPPDDDDDKDKLILVLLVALCAVVYLLVNKYGNPEQIKQHLQGVVYNNMTKWSHVSGNVMKIKARNVNCTECTGINIHTRTTDNSSRSSEEDEQ